MEDLQVIAACALHLMCIHNYLDVLRKKIKRKRRRRRWWMITYHRNRTIQSMENAIQEMLCEDSEEFSNFCRMSPIDFNYLLDKIEPLITKKTTKWRKPIPVKVRLAITLRFLATGDSYRSLHFSRFKISSPLISNIILEVCLAINIVLKDEIKLPQTPEEWISIEEGFRVKFPHCVGAIDGKHIVLENPIGSGSQYYNYKRTFSFVLLALVDSDYNFTFADIGAPGRISDGGVFQNSLLWKRIVQNDLNLPPACPLPGRQKPVPYVFIGDGAFALSTHLMKPYPGNYDRGTLQRTLNYRLSSARVIVENVFGVLTSVFRVLKKPMEVQPKKAKAITMSCILLHNFLRRRETSRNIYTPPGIFDVIVNGEVVQEGNWRRQSQPTSSSALRPLINRARRATFNALEIRDEFSNYFSNLPIDL